MNDDPLHFTTAKHSAVMIVTPEIAANWLQYNTGNRNLSTQSVDKFARLLTEGNFRYNGDAIRFSTDRRLLDAQHRLHGCVKSGVPFESVIAWGIEPGAQITMDRNRKRTRIDHLRIMGEHSTKELATVLNLSVAWDRGDRLSIGHQTKVEYEEAYQYLLDYPAIRSSLAYVEMLGISRVRKVVNPAHLAFIHWVLSCIDQADADDFVEKVVSGQYVESDNEATHRLHVRLRDLRVGRMDKSYEVVPLAMKGWNLYRTGVLTKQLRIRRGGSAPEAFPEPQ